MTMSSKPNRIFLSPPHMGGEEFRFVGEAFDSNYIAPLGPQVDAFEKEFSEYIGLKHSAAVSSGTAAMHMALRCLELGPEDEVFASTLTFIGSVTPALFEGATPVLIDCDRESWNMDTGLLEEELERCERRGKLPRAVVPTDLYGQCCDLQRIVAICDRYGVPVICDSAEAIGGRFLSQRNGSHAKAQRREREKWIHAGKSAKAAVFSFNGNKILTTSGGGMLASDDEELIARARKLSQQAREDFPHYEHRELGYNYRMSNVLAAIGRGQLRVLDQRVKRKREIFEVYREALAGVPGIQFMPEPEWSRSNRWLTVVLITPDEFGVDRETVRLRLERENIEARPVWKPMHLQPVFEVSNGGPPVPSSGARGEVEVGRILNGKSYKARVVGGKVAEDLFERGLCLPSGTGMSEGDLDRVVGTILKCRAGVKRQ